MQIYNKNNTMNVFNSTFNSVSFEVTRSKELCKKKIRHRFISIFFTFFHRSYLINSS